MSQHRLLNPVEDGHCLRPSGGWAIEKLDYLRRYIDAFETSMTVKGIEGVISISLPVLENASSAIQVRSFLDLR